MISTAELRALAEFRHQLRLFLAFSESEARAAGLEPQQHQLLLALRGLPAGLRPTIRVLAERLALRHHSAVELIDRLEHAKLVVRRRSTTDGREILVDISAAGDKLLRRLSRSHQAELRTAGLELHRALKALLSKPPPTPVRRKKTT